MLLLILLRESRMKIVCLTLLLLVDAARSQDCTLIPADLVQSLEGLTSVVFQGFKPTITRVQGDPKLTVLAYGSEPNFQVVDGKLVVSKTVCGTTSPPATSSPTTTTTSSPTLTPVESLATTLSSRISFVVTRGLMSWLSGASDPTTVGLATMLALAASAPLGMAQGDAAVDCESIIEVSFHAKSNIASTFFFFVASHSHARSLLSLLFQTGGNCRAYQVDWICMDGRGD